MTCRGLLFPDFLDSDTRLYVPSAGLSSLSHNDFALYMQLTEELTKELGKTEEDSRPAK